MKKLVLSIIGLCIAVAYGFAQVNPQAPQELDKSVRYGKLDNGLTYYIMHNAKPAQRAEFYIVTNVGAIQETPAQDGLAHFLEHMCLNGTKNFPGKGLISYMESIGCKFGENINAGTGVEVTSYMLNNVPVIREGIIDSSLLILHDYAAYVTNDPKEIEEERGVILEEKRTRDNYQWRAMTAVRKALFQGSKLADCSIIGSEENLKTFKPEELVSFYKTWYRPDMQAIIVVGDVNVDAIEGKIKTLFSGIPKAENPKAKDVILVPDNKEPIVSIFTDKELNSTEVSLYIKTPAMPKEYRGLGMYMLQDLMQSLIGRMLNERLGDIAKSANAPFLGAGVGFSPICETMDIFSASAQAKDGEGIKAFTAMLTEVERAKRFGFTEDEFERAKTNILRSYERAKENASSRQNAQLVDPLTNHFTSGYAYTTPEYDYNTAQAYLNMIPLAALNQGLGQLIKDENIVISYNAPAREGLAIPSQADLTGVLATVKNADIKAPETTSVKEPLLDASLLKGSVVKNTQTGKFGTTIWTLTNGIEVIVKPTDYKKDEVLINMVFKGGKSILPQEVLLSLDRNIFGVYRQNAGLSKFPQTQLSKMLAGKAVGISPSISELTHGLSGSSSPKDLETAMQILYLNYTAPRCEAAEFEVGLNQIKSVLPNMMKQPNFIYSMQLQKLIANNSSRRPVLDEQNISQANIEHIKKALGILYADAAGAKVYITGNVNLAELKPLVEKYIGSLPVKAKKAGNWVDHNISTPTGMLDKSFDFEMQTPKTTVGLLYTGKMAYTQENDILMTVLQQVLNQLYTKTIREEEGGTYGVGVETQVTGEPKEKFLLFIGFDTDPAKAPKLIELAKQGLQGIADKGPNPEYVTKSKENLLKAYPEKQISNSFWAGLIYDYYSFNRDFDNNYVEVVNKVVTPENVQKLVKEMLEQKNLVEINMRPKAK